MQFIIDQRIDLSMDNPMLTYQHPLVAGDDRAHLWWVRVYNRGQPESLAGCTVSCYVRREGDWRGRKEPTLYMPGEVRDGAAVAEFIPEVYALGGPLVAVMRITDGHGIATAAIMRLRADSYVTDEISDPSGSVLSMDELLAQIETMRQTTQAGQTQQNNVAAAEAKRVEAERARVKEHSTNQTASKEQTARAQAAADRLSEFAVEVESLPPSADPTAQVEQTAKKTTVLLGIPTSNFAYATFYINPETRQLVMRVPNGFSAIQFAIKDRRLVVRINGE